ncbi:hypothetical protein BaRGS_00018505 [Batillaria attramentaria]|uniref:Cyclic nucleotide-binding domain-containing protein n=1 Tax=Batillaria attramentaria TaxID=370345 RepID=A0ABD0KSM6_9CAEN
MGSLQERAVILINQPPAARAEREIDMVLPWLQKRSQLLMEMERDTLKDILRHCSYQQAQRDDTIIRQGDRGDNTHRDGQKGCGTVLLAHRSKFQSTLNPAHFRLHKFASTVSRIVVSSLDEWKSVQYPSVRHTNRSVKQARGHLSVTNGKQDKLIPCGNFVKILAVLGFGQSICSHTTTTRLLIGYFLSGGIVRNLVHSGFNLRVFCKETEGGIVYGVTARAIVTMTLMTFVCDLATRGLHLIIF